jgi:hypothetical protein
MNRTHIENISHRLQLSPYQSYILLINGHKYRLDSLMKRGEVLYAPYTCNLTRNTKDYFGKILFGHRADLIGSDKMLVIGQRGVKLYPTGLYKAFDHSGQHYYANSQGHRVARSIFENMLGF